MRLICPNCDAQYEVSDDVIPAEGRDVQCSNCGQTWYQHHPDHMPVEEPAEALPDDLAEVDDAPGEDEERSEVAAPPPPPAPEPDIPTEPERRPLGEGVADILREEASRETEARAAETIETQPDLGLEGAESETERRAREARDRMARLRGEEPTPAETTVGSRRELLPDIEEINSTLRAAGTRETRAPEQDLETNEPAARRGGFRRGFRLMVMLAVILGAIYVFAPQIAQAVPQADPYLSAYVAWVDQGRVWLDSQVANGLAWLDQVAADTE